MPGSAVQQLTNMNTHYLRNPTSKLDATNYNTGCARPTAVAPQPLGLWRCFQGKSWRLYLYFAYKSGFKGVRAILKAVEAVKVKLWCFKGIVNPTHFQKHVGWGTWLAFPPLPCHSPPKSVGQKAIAPPGGDQEKTAGESFTEKTSHCMDGIFNHLHPVHGTHFKH